MRAPVVLAVVALPMLGVGSIASSGTAKRLVRRHADPLMESKGPTR